MKFVGAFWLCLWIKRRQENAVIFELLFFYLLLKLLELCVFHFYEHLYLLFPDIDLVHFRIASQEI